MLRRLPLRPRPAGDALPSLSGVSGCMDTQKCYGLAAPHRAPRERIAARP